MSLQKSGIQYVSQDLGSFLRDVGRANSAVESFGRTAGTVGNRVSAAGHVMIGAFREVGAIGTRALFDLGRAATGLAVDFGKSALGGAMDLQDSMNLLQATSGATGQQIDILKQKARELGADLTLPATSAADAGNAMLELSKAGLTVDQVMAAAKGTLQLAAAANISEAEAAEIAANALNSFNLSGDKAGFVADLLAGAANKSSIEIGDAAASFKMASAIFSAFQAPVVGAEKAMIDMTAAIALMGNAGIKGSDAGTSLKQMLLQLTGPSDKAKGLMQDLAHSIGVSGDIAFTSSGKMRSLREILDLVARSTAKMTEEERARTLTTIFGADASRAVITLMQAGPKAFDEMTRAITQQGSAASLAAARTAGLRGAWDGLKSQIETAGLVLAEPFLEPLELGLSSISDIISELPIDKWAKGASQALSTLVHTIQGIGEDPIVNPLVGFSGGDVAPTGGLGGGWIRESIPDMFAAFLEYRNQLTTIILANAPMVLDTLGAWGDALGTWIMTNAPRMIQIFGEKTSEFIGTIGQYAPIILEKLGEWGGKLGQWIIDAAPGMLRELGNAAGKILDAIGEALPGIVEGLASWGAKFIAWVPEALPGLVDELLVMATDVQNWIIERAPEIGKQLGEWGLAFIKWVGPAATELVIAAGEIVGKLGIWIIQNQPMIYEKLGEWTLAFTGWVMNDAIPALLVALGNMATRILSYLGEKAADIAKDGSVGRAIVDGIRGGIAGAWAGLTAFITEKASGLVKTIKNVLKIQSPSLITADEIGLPFAEGIGVGINQGLLKVHQTLASVMTSLASPQTVTPSQRGDMFIPQQAQQIAQGMGGTNSVSVQINNPIVDSNERIGQLGAQIRRSVFAAINNGVDGLRAEGVS